MASIYQYFSKDPIIKRTVKCKYCKKYISEKVCLLFRPVTSVIRLAIEKEGRNEMKENKKSKLSSMRRILADT